MIYTIVQEFPNKVLLKDHKAAVSIYMPTHRMYTERERDILVYKNLVKDIDSMLEETLDKKAAAILSGSLHALETDLDLWNESLDGLALFATLDEILVYRLPEPVSPLATLGTQFHLVPIMQVFQTHNSVVLLALNADRFGLYQAGPYGIHPLDLPESMPTTLPKVLGHHHTDKYHTHGSYSSVSNRSTFHGHGGAPAEEELDQLRFFKRINQLLSSYLPDTYPMPVIVVALDHLQAEFMKHSTIASLESPGILGSFDDFEETDLLAILSERANSSFDATIEPLIERYHALKNQGLSAPDSTKLQSALSEGRVDTLFIAADQDELADHGNTMLHQALAKGTHVFVLDQDKMPDATIAAGFLRY
jgi:acetyl esterase/lipase